MGSKKMAMIAKIVDAKTKGVIGYRLAEVTEDTVGNANIKDVPTRAIVNILSKGAKIDNIGLSEKGEVVGTNGSLERYTSVVLGTELYCGLKAPAVILYSINDGDGYAIINYLGKVGRCSNKTALELVNKRGIANGKVVDRDGVTFISSIFGNYDTMVLEKNNAKAKAIQVENEKPKDAHNEQVLADNVASEINNTQATEDVFKVLTQEQIDAINKYYVFETVRVYEGLTHTTELKMDMKKIIKLDKIRGNLTWDFGGVRDVLGDEESYCTLGHKIKHEYKAIGKDADGNEVEEVIFGEVCVGDFFQLTKESLSALVKSRRQMSAELKTIAQELTDGVDPREGLEMFYDYMDILIKETEDEESGLYSIFGEELAEAILSFRHLGIRYPASLVRMTSATLAKHPMLAVSKLVNWGDTITALDKDETGLTSTIKEYIQFMFGNRIKGMYAYDPINELNRNDGEGFNKEARNKWISRDRRLKRYLGVTCDSLEEIKHIMLMFKMEKVFIDATDKMRDEFEVKDSMNSLYYKVKGVYDDGDLDVFARRIICHMDTIATLSNNIKAPLSEREEILKGYYAKGASILSKCKEALDKVYGKKEEPKVLKDANDYDTMEIEPYKVKLEKAKSKINTNSTDYERKCIDIATDIINRGLKYNELSAKQQSIMDNMVSIADTGAAIKYNKGIDKDSDLYKRAQAIYGIKEGSDLAKDIDAFDEIGRAIAMGVERTCRCSKRQAYHINNVYEQFKDRF